MCALADELLTIQEAMARVKVSRRTIYNWLADKKIETVRTPSGRLRIYAASLIQPSERADA
jgi:excisionase family DNA binding protein